MDWLAVAVQAGGAIAVCGMFLWFLKNKGEADDKARNEFLAHLQSKDELFQASLTERDKASKEIAKSGHDALRDVSQQVNELRAEIRAKLNTT